MSNVMWYYMQLMTAQRDVKAQKCNIFWYIYIRTWTLNKNRPGSIALSNSFITQGSYNSQPEYQNYTVK